MKHEETPQLCMCCRLPLTYSKKMVAYPSAANPKPEPVMVESWDCTNQACITYRNRLPKIPNPPMSK